MQLAWQITWQKATGFLCLNKKSFTNVASDLEFKEAKYFPVLRFYSAEIFETQKEELFQIFIHCPPNFFRKGRSKSISGSMFLCRNTQVLVIWHKQAK